MRRRRNHVPWTGLYAGLPNLASTHEQGLADFEAPTWVRRLPAAWRVGTWAAGSVFTLVQAMLGSCRTPHGGKLCVDPLLPEWLPDLTVSDLRVGKQQFDIFWR